MSTQFPSVPAYAGVPLLARLGTPATITDAATTVGANLAMTAQLGLPATVTFGVKPLFSGLNLQPFDPSYSIDGKTDIYFDSVLEFEIDAGSSIASHPLEKGQFAAYNRVQSAIKIRMVLASQGKEDRSNFLTALETMRESTDLYTITTPDTSYSNMVLKDYSYKKTAEKGAVTIWADTQWEEARSTNVTVSTTTSAQPQGAQTQNTGSATPQTPAASTSSVINNPTTPPAALPADVSSEQPPSGAAS